MSNYNEALALNTVHVGDCLELMRDIPDKSVDMILCDLPYGTTRNKWDSVIPLDEMWAQYERIIKDNGAIVLAAQTPFDKVLGVSNLQLLRYEWIWEKDKATGFLNAKKMPLKAHENVLVFYKKLPTYNAQVTEGHKPQNTSYSIPKTQQTNYGEYDPKKTGGQTTRQPRTVQKFNTPKHNSVDVGGLHPTQKPVALFEYLIRTYTNEGETILDNCIGSGTTGVAALNTGRNFIGIEQDADYARIANERIAEVLE